MAKASVLLSLRPDEIRRGLAALEQTEILVRGGGKLRIVPDLFADYLLETASVDGSGAATGFADAVFAVFEESHLSNLLKNLAELDWRITESGNPSDLLENIWSGKDYRSDALELRKQELRRLLAAVPADSPLKHADHVDGSGIALFERVCQLDLEGIVAKLKSAPYVSDRESSTWLKILNPDYRRGKAGKNSSSATGATSRFPGGILVSWHVRNWKRRVETSMNRCEVVGVRNLVDAAGFPCIRIASKQCCDCGIKICESVVAVP